MIPLIQRLLPVAMIGIATCLASCWDTGRRNLPDVVRPEAYVPVYEPNPDPTIIKSTAPKPIVNSGKIYVRGNLLFQVETYAGIHVIDYTDKLHPVKLGFINVAGCSDLAVKGNHLIVNHMGDLVSIDISSASSVKEVARIKNVFHSFVSQDAMQRPPASGYFVCPDYTKGYVKGWKLEKDVKGAHCYNN